MHDTYTEKEYEPSRENEGDTTCLDEPDLADLISTVQGNIDEINSQPNRYKKILEVR